MLQTGSIICPSQPIVFAVCYLFHLNLMQNTFTVEEMHHSKGDKINE